MTVGQMIGIFMLGNGTATEAIVLSTGWNQPWVILGGFGLMVFGIFVAVVCTPEPTP